MADIVNLNRVRKKKRAADKEKSAARNRAKFGRTKSDKLVARLEESRKNEFLAAHRNEKMPDKEEK